MSYIQFIDVKRKKIEEIKDLWTITNSAADLSEEKKSLTN